MSLTAPAAPFHALTVKACRPETRDAVAVTFAVPDALAETFKFTQGQYLTLRTRLDGEDLRRSYSLCQGVHDGILEVAIKKVDGGAFSSWACGHLRPGMTVEVAPPAGRFFVPLAADNARHYLGIAAGSGITPLMSIIRTTLVAEPHSRFILIYGNRSTASVIFREALLDLKNRHLDRLTLIFVMSREPQETALLSGRLDADKCRALFDSVVDLAEIDATFICGPEEMAQTVMAVLGERGVDPAKVKCELFGSTAAAPRRATAAGNRCQATAVMDGHAFSFTVDGAKETVLEAALAQGLELPYSCKGGVCSTCIAKLTAGEVEMDRNFALEDYELARGFVLSCQSRPLTPTITLDFDQHA